MEKRREDFRVLSRYSTFGVAFRARLTRDITFADIQRACARLSSLFTDKLYASPSNGHKNFFVFVPDSAEGGMRLESWGGSHPYPSQDDFPFHEYEYVTYKRYKTARFQYSDQHDYPERFALRGVSPETAESHVVYKETQYRPRTRQRRDYIDVQLRASFDMPPWKEDEIAVLAEAMRECLGTKATRFVPVKKITYEAYEMVPFPPKDRDTD